MEKKTSPTRLHVALIGLFAVTLPSSLPAETEYDTSDRCYVNPQPGINLSFCDLRGSDFSEVDLSNANLRGANLLVSTLYKTNLSGADLRGAQMSGSDLRKANFQGADLRGAFMVKSMIGHMETQNALMSGLTWNNLDVCTEGSVGECINGQ